MLLQNSLYKNAIAKTKLCGHHTKGFCRLGENCRFAHGEDELRPAPDLRKTVICRSVTLKHPCRKGSGCTFAHSEEELSEGLERAHKLYGDLLAERQVDHSGPSEGNGHERRHGDADSNTGSGGGGGGVSGTFQASSKGRGGGRGNMNAAEQSGDFRRGSNNNYSHSDHQQQSSNVGGFPRSPILSRGDQQPPAPPSGVKDIWESPPGLSLPHSRTTTKGTEGGENENFDMKREAQREARERERNGGRNKRRGGGGEGPGGKSHGGGGGGGPGQIHMNTKTNDNVMHGTGMGGRSAGGEVPDWLQRLRIGSEISHNQQQPCTNQHGGPQYGPCSPEGEEETPYSRGPRGPMPTSNNNWQQHHSGSSMGMPASRDLQGLSRRQQGDSIGGGAFNGISLLSSYSTQNSTMPACVNQQGRSSAGGPGGSFYGGPPPYGAGGLHPTSNELDGGPSGYRNQQTPHGVPMPPMPNANGGIGKNPMHAPHLPPFQQDAPHLSFHRQGGPGHHPNHVAATNSNPPPSVPNYPMQMPPNAQQIDLTPEDYANNPTQTATASCGVNGALFSQARADARGSPPAGAPLTPNASPLQAAAAGIDSTTLLAVATLASSLRGTDTIKFLTDLLQQNTQRANQSHQQTATAPTQTHTPTGSPQTGPQIRPHAGAEQWTQAQPATDHAGGMQLQRQSPTNTTMTPQQMGGGLAPQQQQQQATNLMSLLQQQPAATQQPANGGPFTPNRQQHQSAGPQDDGPPPSNQNQIQQLQPEGGPAGRGGMGGSSPTGPMDFRTLAPQWTGGREGAGRGQ